MNTYMVDTEEKLDYPENWKNSKGETVIWLFSVLAGVSAFVATVFFAAYLLSEDTKALVLACCSVIFISGFASVAIYYNRDRKKSLHLFASTVMWLIKKRHGINMSRNDAYALLLPVGSNIIKQATVNVDGEQVTVELGSQEDGKDIRFYHVRSNEELSFK